MFLARKLEEETMGLYIIALMVVFLLKIVSDMGVDLAFVKQYPEANEQEKSSLLRSSFAIRTASCIFFTLIYLLVERSGKVSFINDIAHVTALTLLMYWMHSFRELMLRLLQAEQLFTIYAIVQVLAAVIKVFCVFALFVFQDVTVGMVLVCEAIAFAASIIYAAIKLKSKLVAALKAKFVGGVQLIKFGYPLYLNAILNLGNEKVSQYIVAGFGGPLTMAYFGMAERLSDAGTRIFEAFANVYYPSQTNHFANNQQQLALNMAMRSMMWVTFVITCAIVGFAILREPVIKLFFSSKYISVANAAVLFFGVLLFRSTQTLMGYFGVAAGLKFLPVRVSTVSSVVNVSLCFIMFKMYGYQGAIATLLLTQLLMNFLYHYWLKKAGFHINVEPVITLCSITAIAIALTYFLEDHFFISLFVFPLFFVACLSALPILRNDLFEFSGKAIVAVQNKFSGTQTTKA